jgi:hypothetical protein
MAHTGIRPLRPLEIATAPYQDVATTDMPGSLMYEGGCLLFRNEQRRAILMPVWPSGSIFNGTAVVFHEPGKTDQRIMIAEEFVLSGQPTQWSTLDPAAAYASLRRQCGAYQPFFVSSVRPAN